MNNFGLGRTTNRNSENIENFKLNREINLFSNSNKNILEDRDMFNQFSNISENIDITSFNLNDSYGMPIHNGQIMNNKKSLLSNPYIIENNEKNNFVASSSTFDTNDMYAELEIDNKNNMSNNKINNDDMLNMAYNNINLLDENHNSKCIVEENILEFEYKYIKEKKDKIRVDVSSPYALAYLWKIIILLSKNPTSDKILQTFRLKNKEEIITEVKKNSNVFDEYGNLRISIPENFNKTINISFIKKIEEIYKVKIEQNTNLDENIIEINLDYNFELEIPKKYNPEIIINYLSDYRENRIKFLKLNNIPVSLIVDKQNDIVNIEIPFNGNTVLGFIYNTNQRLLESIPYDLILLDKEPDHLIKELIIPKINKNKKSKYSKKFEELFNKVHLGEIIYGNLYNLDINTNLGISINIVDENLENKYKLESSYENIVINHRCFYYIKNKKIVNKILSCGIIDY